MSGLLMIMLKIQVRRELELGSLKDVENYISLKKQTN